MFLLKKAIANLSDLHFRGILEICVVIYYW
jgi:hypothetical protein